MRGEVAGLERERGEMLSTISSLQKHTQDLSNDLEEVRWSAKISSLASGTHPRRSSSHLSTSSSPMVKTKMKKKPSYKKFKPKPTKKRHKQSQQPSPPSSRRRQSPLDLKSKPLTSSKDIKERHEHLSGLYLNSPFFDSFFKF